MLMLAGCAAVAIGLSVWCGRAASTAPRGWIVGVSAIDADTAVVTWRANYAEGPSRSWVGRVDGSGRTHWVQPVPDLQYAVGPGSGIIVAGDVVAIRYGHRENYRTTDHAVAAYSLDDGHSLWDVTLTPYHPKELEGIGRSEPGLHLYHSALPLEDGKLAIWADDGRELALYVLDAATGAVLSRRPAPEMSYAATALGSHVITSSVDETTVFDVKGDGPPAKLQTHYEGCVIGDEYLIVEGADSDQTLVALRDGNPAARRVIAAPFRPLDSAVSLRRCGRFQDRLVMLVQTRGPGVVMEQSFVLITDADGALLHAIELGSDTLLPDAEGVAQRYPDRAPLAGDLPRFAPFVQSSYDGGRSTMRLLMLDLARGEIAWTGPPDQKLNQMTLFRAGKRWYGFWPYTTWVLSTFDGTTGELTAAAQLYDYNGIDELTPANVAGDRVWVAGGTWTTFDKAQLAVLDGATLVPTFARGVKVTDVTASVRQALNAR